MSALPGDIEAATRPAAVDEQQDAAIQTAHPNARDGRESPAFGLCDSAADTAALNAERFALLSVVRRRFAVEVDGLRFDLVPGTVTAAATLTVPELAASALPVLIARAEFDLVAQRTRLELWG